MKHSLFIADLHLKPEQPKTVKLFFEFLQTTALKADALYILGDLFEAWIGDDDNTPLSLEIKTQLENTAKKIPIYILPGNRDFLIGKRFAKKTDCNILKDPTKIDLYGAPTLLTHGDMLCTDDTWHQVFRFFATNRTLQKFFYLFPLALRQKIANFMRKKSKQNNIKKSDTIKSVIAKTVTKTVKRHKVKQLIHGHTHLPGIHESDIDGNHIRRIVLGEWNNSISVLVYQEDHKVMFLHHE